MCFLLCVFFVSVVQGDKKTVGAHFEYRLPATNVFRRLMKKNTVEMQFIEVLVFYFIFEIIGFARVGLQ